MKIEVAVMVPNKPYAFCGRKATFEDAKTPQYWHDLLDTVLFTRPSHR